MNRLVVAIVGAIALGWSGSVAAQNCGYGQDFDSCMAQQLGALQQQNAMGMQQLYAAYLQEFGPLLEREYAAWGYQTGASFDDFALYMLRTANGTDIQGALDLQRQTFEGLQRAHRSQDEAGRIVIDSAGRNSDAAIKAVEGYTLSAVRGNVIVDGPNGQVELPYSNVEIGQRFNANDGYTYMLTPDGYAVLTGFGWTLLPR